MTYRFEAFGFTVDAQGWACAREAGEVGFGIGTLEAMVLGQMMASAEWADDGILWAATVLHVMTEGVAPVALFDKGKRVKEFDDTRAAKEEEGSCKEASEPRPIFVKESKDDRRLGLFHGKRRTEPLRLLDDSKTNTRLIACKL